MIAYVMVFGLVLERSAASCHLMFYLALFRTLLNWLLIIVMTLPEQFLFKILLIACFIYNIYPPETSFFFFSLFLPGIGCKSNHIQEKEKKELSSNERASTGINWMDWTIFRTRLGLIPSCVDPPPHSSPNKGKGKEIDTHKKKKEEAHFGYYLSIWLCF